MTTSEVRFALYYSRGFGITENMRRLPLALQTIYVDLLDKLLDDQVATQGREEGSFAPKTIKAVIPYGAGILVNVPDPVRYAWHKLIVAERGTVHEKVPKDLVQAETLFEVLVEDRPDDVRDMWEEVATEGRKSWQQIALDGLRRITPTISDRVLKAIDQKID